jgi:hypothetical protein
MLNIFLVETQKSKEVVNSQEKFITLEKMLLDIGKQMLKTSYILNLGQLFTIVPKLNRYLWQKLKPEKTHNLSKTTIDKQVGYLVPKVGIVVIVINNHMVVIQV